VGPARVWTSEEIQFAASIADQVSLAFETAERMRVQETLFDSEAKFRTIIEQLADGFVLIDADGTIIECNHAQELISGMPRDRILGQRVWTITSAAAPVRSRSEAMTRKLKAAVLSAIADSGSPIFGSPREFAYVRADGTEGFLQQVLFPIRFTDGNRIGAVSRDVTERRRTEEKIRASLAEKVLMLKEIHHRVKNNLQVISSLLSLQSGSIKDPRDLALFKESEDRIRSMALIHEKLYQSSDFSRVDFRQYLESLVGYLFRSYRVADVRYEMEIDDIHLGINAAIPCGLVLNELLTNALKHAFPHGRGGVILLRLSRLEGDRARLTVRDDGIGLPEGFDPEKSQSLGMHLTRILAQQLDGTLRHRNEGGAVFEMEFPIDPGVILTSSRARES
jgi:PAS domain S-box-containing protein